MSERDDSVYVNDMLDAIGAIKGFISGMDYPAFLGDRKTYSATVRELEVIGEASGKISEALKAEHPEIDWRTIKDFRNVLAHEYFNINGEILWDIVQNKLEPLKNQIAVLAII
ncbi:MAG: DUF86 domain-containing protein [Nitrospirota bacterium]|nr:DUF86 domain-containing protein [Nitrospirota bacterium]